MDGLTLEGVVDAVVDHFEFREQAEPQIEDFLEEYFEERALIERQVKTAVRELVDRILYTSKENKDLLLSYLTLVDSKYHEMEQTRETIEYETNGWIQEADFCISLDAIRLVQASTLSKFVSGNSGFLHAEEVTINRYDLTHLG